MKKYPVNSTVNGGYISGEDSTCWITCKCGYGIKLGESKLFINDTEITRCPNCGRGYKTEFVVWQFNPDEKEKNED